jgi:hypothetical protein
VKVSVQGRKQLAAKIKAASSNVEDRVNRAVAVAGEDLLTVAMPGVPLDEGPLRRSGYVEHRPGVAVVGFSAPHAVYAHEMGFTVYEGREINWTTPGTGAKYLTRPFLENRERYAKDIKDAARRGLNDG